MTALEHDELGADPAGLVERHGGRHAPRAGLVARGGDHAAADGHRPPAQARVDKLLDGGEEGIDVQVEDRGGDGRTINWTV